VWLLAVQYAHSCFTMHECMSAGTARAALQGAHDQFLQEAASLFARVSGSGAEAPWIRRLGKPTDIIARQAFRPHHLDFAASVISGLDNLEPQEVTGMLHDLSMRVAFSNCGMLAQLLAHFTLTELRISGQMAAAVTYFPVLEFHGEACCRRYHVLAGLIPALGSRSSRIHMVEVGVNNALTSQFLLSRFPDLEFDGVDPYVDAEAIHQEAKGRLLSFGARARLWHLTSEAAAERFEPGSLDLVFIDGDHSRDAVIADLHAWHSRVRPGGLLAGHDLFNPAFDGVLQALLAHLSETASNMDSSLAPTIHFAPDFVWWLQV